MGMGNRKNWVALVNAGQTEVELETLRRSVERVPVPRCAAAKKNRRAFMPGVHTPPAASAPKEAMNVGRRWAIAEIDRSRRNGVYPLYFIRLACTPRCTGLTA